MDICKKDIWITNATTSKRKTKLLHGMNGRGPELLGTSHARHSGATAAICEASLDPVWSVQNNLKCAVQKNRSIVGWQQKTG